MNTIDMQQRIERLERGLRRFGAVQCDQCGEWVESDSLQTLHLKRSISNQFGIICYDCVIDGLVNGSEFIEIMQKQKFDKSHGYSLLTMWWEWERRNADTYARDKSGTCFSGDVEVRMLIEQCFGPLKKRCPMWQAAHIIKSEYSGAYSTFEHVSKFVSDGRLEKFWKNANSKEHQTNGNGVK
jgi:hypothetical protein